MLVHPDEAVRRLKAFVEVYGTGPSRGGGGGAISGPLRMQGMLRRAAEREQVGTLQRDSLGRKPVRPWARTVLTCGPLGFGALHSRCPGKQWHGLRRERAAPVAPSPSLHVIVWLLARVSPAPTLPCPARSSRPA